MGPSNLIVRTDKLFQGWLTGRQVRRPYVIRKPSRDERSYAKITVGKLLTSIKTFPRQSLLLGLCMDGLPFLMDLSDPITGSILITGDPGCGKTHHLQVAVDSAIRTNTPSELQVAVITHNPGEWRYLRESKQYKIYLQDILPWYDIRAETTIQRLTELADARRDGKQDGYKVLFILDDINFIEDLSYEAQVNLHWLLAYGAQSGVLLIASVKSSYANTLSYWLETFRTRILGRIHSTSNAKILANRSDSKVFNLEPPNFRVWSGTEWMTYRLPILGD